MTQIRTTADAHGAIREEVRKSMPELSTNQEAIIALLILKNTFGEIHDGVLTEEQTANFDAKKITGEALAKLETPEQGEPQ